MKEGTIVKSQVKKIDATKVELNIEIPKEIVEKEFDEVYIKIGESAKIPGFRPGKAPRNILEKHHSRLAQDEVIKNLIPRAYEDSVKNENLNVVELPQITDVKLDSNTLSFKATVEVRPEIKVENYKGIKIKYKKPNVTQEEVDKTVNELKDLRKADTIDDKFARGLGYNTAGGMRLSIERQLFVQKESDLKYQLQGQILADILHRAHFQIPQSLVERRLEELIRSAKVRMGIQGVAKEEISSKEDELRKRLRPEAEEQIKTFLVLEEIAKKEKIAEEEHLTERVIEFLLSEAEWVNES